MSDNDFEGVALVWGESQTDLGPCFTPPSAGVGLWGHVTGLPWLRWRDAREMPSFVDVKVALVNLFWVDNHHIRDLKKRYPHVKVVAMPDASLDMVLSHPQWSDFWDELYAADAIFGRTRVDVSIYGSLTGKPCWVMPSPVGPASWFEAQWAAKEPFILATDHVFAPVNTTYNVAHLLEAQGQTGLPIKYVRPEPQTVSAARRAGLAVEFIERLPFEEMVKLTAKAAMCVDMYPSHAMGRHQVVCGYVKTPVITSWWTEDAPGVKIRLENPGATGSTAKLVVENESFRQSIAETQLENAKRYDFGPSRDRLVRALSEVKGLLP